MAPCTKAAIPSSSATAETEEATASAFVVRRARVAPARRRSVCGRLADTDHQHAGQGGVGEIGRAHDGELGDLAGLAVGIGGDEHLEEVGAEVVGQLGGTWPQRRSVLARQHRDGDDTGPGQPGGRNVAERELGRGNLRWERHAQDPNRPQTDGPRSPLLGLRGPVRSGLLLGPVSRPRLECLAERGCLVLVELHHETATAFEGNPHHDATTLLGDLERAVARPRLHGRHVHTFSHVIRAQDAPNSDHYSSCTKVPDHTTSLVGQTQPDRRLDNVLTGEETR